MMVGAVNIGFNFVGSALTPLEDTTKAKKLKVHFFRLI